MLILKKKDEMINRDLKDLEALIFPMLMASENESERKKEILNLVKKEGPAIASLIYSNIEDDSPFMVRLTTDIPAIVDYVMGSDNSKPSGKPIAPPIPPPTRIVRR
jgi:hypothetical protein